MQLTGTRIRVKWLLCSKDRLSAQDPPGAPTFDAMARNASQTAAPSQRQHPSQASTQAAPTQAAPLDEKLFTLGMLKYSACIYQHLSVAPVHCRETPAGVQQISCIASAVCMLHLFQTWATLQQYGIVKGLAAGQDSVCLQTICPLRMGVVLLQ